MTISVLPVVFVSPSEHLSFIQAAGDTRVTDDQLEEGKKSFKHLNAGTFYSSPNIYKLRLCGQHLEKKTGLSLRKDRADFLRKFRFFSVWCKMLHISTSLRWRMQFYLQSSEPGAHTRRKAGSVLETALELILAKHEEQLYST